jgi:1,4-alpha-glucan branching enzyme
LFVLHTHLPYVKKPGAFFSHEENWFFEVLIDSYIPLFALLEDIEEEGVDYAITVSFTPSVLEMMGDLELSLRFFKYLEILVDVAERKLRTDNIEEASCTRYYKKRFEECRRRFFEAWNGNIIAVLKKLHKARRVEIITSCASHAYLPLWESNPISIKWQVRTGVAYYKNIFKTQPRGFWLPECGYYSGLENNLLDESLNFFFLEHHGIMKGTPIPEKGVNLPVVCPNGVIAFGRDWLPHNKVWDDFCGYPADSTYLDFYSDIGLMLDGYTLEYLTGSSDKRTIGIRCRARNGAAYCTKAAEKKCNDHVNDFIDVCEKRFIELIENGNSEPVIVALFDTEHFGHYWHEGVYWLSSFIREVSSSERLFRLSTPSIYLAGSPTLQFCSPSYSSWGYKGYNETWLVGENHWIYPLVLKLGEAVENAIRVESNDFRVKLAQQQLLRELMMAQTSDWAYMIQKNSFPEYAKRRLEKHCENIIALLDSLKRDRLSIEQINDIKKGTGFLRHFDLGDVMT